MREPYWIDELISTWKSGSSNFLILNGNIADYALSGVLLYDFLKVKLTQAGFGFITEMSVHGGDGQISSVATAVKSLTSNEPHNPNAVLVKNPELLFPNGVEARGIKEEIKDFSRLYDALTSKEFIQSNNVLIFITEAKQTFNQRFLSAQARGTLIDVEFPDESLRYDFILEQLENYPGLLKDLTAKELARATAGLTLMSIEDVMLKGRMCGGLERKLVIERKKELITKEYGDVLEIMDSDGYSFNDFAGQDHLKEYHREVIIEPMLSGDVEIVPKGLLYTGPPGTGKTHFARCLAGEAGMNFVELKPQNLRSKWVGDSEKNFAKALACIKSITPVGVFIDELEQVFSRGTEGESNAVRGNFFSMFLTILSEPKHRGEIVWIGATNYPNKLDEALKRTGRFDKKMPFLPPGMEDRSKVFEIYLNKSRLTCSVPKVDMLNFAKLTDGYTQAEIEGIVVKAVEVAARKKKRFIESSDVEYAIECISKIESDKLQEMINIAIYECNDAEFIPDNYKKKKEPV